MTAELVSRWDRVAHRLGQEPDTSIAADLGCCPETVRLRRLALGIPTYEPPRWWDPRTIRAARDVGLFRWWAMSEGLPLFEPPRVVQALEGLGVLSDSAVARLLEGVAEHATESAVRKRRKAMGIAASCRRRHDALYACSDLGRLSDRVVGASLGVSHHIVRRVREGLGIEPLAKRGTKPKGIAWDEQPLGLEPDARIAARLEVSPNTVLQARRARGIPAFRRSA